MWGVKEEGAQTGGQSVSLGTGRTSTSPPVLRGGGAVDGVLDVCVAPGVCFWVCGDAT